METHWNYRVIRKTVDYNGQPYVTLGIHEVYYTNGNPDAWTIDPMLVDCDEEDGIEALREGLERMLTALDKPIIEYDTRDVNDKD